MTWSPGAPPTVEVYSDADALANAAAALIARVARQSVEARGSFSVVLSGGSTPRRTYELLGGSFAQQVPWDRTHVFFSDERVVPVSDPRNNYGMARSALLSRVPIPAHQVHPMPTEGAPPADLAARYEVALRSQGAFDLALMGMGADGHTASLFPGDASLNESERWVVAALAPEGTEVRQRLTLTLPALDRVRHIVFLVTGPDKRATVARVLGSPREGNKTPLPASLVRGIHATDWLLDAAAASLS